MDIASTIVSARATCCRSSGDLVFVGSSFADDLFDFIGLGRRPRTCWKSISTLADGACSWRCSCFSFVYFITPDVRQRFVALMTPGALVEVLLSLAASSSFSTYVSQRGRRRRECGAFRGTMVHVAWLWLTNITFLFGAELNAEVERPGAEAARRRAAPAHARPAPPAQAR